MVRTTPQTHDYSTHRGWGHDYVFNTEDGGIHGRMMGWGCGIEPGDYLIIQHHLGGSTRYLVTTIEYKSDPADMWAAEVEFAPRPAA